MLNVKNEKLYQLLETLFSDQNILQNLDNDLGKQTVNSEIDSKHQSIDDQAMEDDMSPTNIVNEKGKIDQHSNLIDTNEKAIDGISDDSMLPDSVMGGNSVNELSDSINATANVSESWDGGYKVDLSFDIPEGSDASWDIDLKGFAGSVREVYGLDIIDQSGDTLTVAPESGYQSSDYSGDRGNGTIIVDGSPPNDLSVGSNNTGSVSLPVGDSTTFDIGDDSLSDNLIPENVESDLVGQPMGGAIDLGNNQSLSNPQSGQFNYGEALQKGLLYYDANESGRISSDNKFEWRGDAITGINEGELNQGIHDTYYDAGDHVMFGQPLGYSNFAIGFGVNQYRQAYQDSGQLDEALDIIKRMSDGIMAGHEMSGGKTKSFVAQIGYGGNDAKGSHKFWNPPEQEQSSREISRIYEGQAGTEVAADYAAGLAQAAIAFKGIDSAYSDKLLDNAKALFSHAETYQGKYSDTIPQASPFYKSHSGFADELSAAAGSLYQATGDNSYLQKAEDTFNQNGVGYTDFAPSADNVSTLATLILAQESSDPKYQQAFENWADQWVEGKGSIKHSPGGQAFRQAWGSAVLSSSAAFAIETYADTVKDVAGYGEFATNQIDYVLGDNPRNSSYLVGFGNNSPQSPHHRGSAGSQGNDASSTPNDNILYGALVGGPSAADDYSYNDHRQDHVTNEVGVSYNAALTGALVQQYDNFGGDALTDQQLDDLVGVNIDF